jgi:hypothetical protein
MRIQFVQAAAWAAIACVAVPASAGVSTAHYIRCFDEEHGDDEEPLGDFEAFVTYAHEGEGTAQVSVDLRNITIPSRGGYITAIALNGGTGVTGMSFESCTMGSFGGLSYPVQAPPFGDFLVGAAIGHSWLGGGGPSSGIGVGGSATFVFSVTGSANALGDLTAETVFGGALQMAIRFRGGTPDDWSDKALGCAMPAPGAIALLAAVGMLSTRRRA